MAHHVEFREDWSCVHLIHTGNYGINEAYASRYDVRDLLVTNKNRKVLVDIRLANYLFTEEEEDLYLQSLRNLLPLGVSVALVMDGSMMENKDLVEKLSMAPGVMQRLFPDEPEALDWLLKVD